MSHSPEGDPWRSPGPMPPPPPYTAPPYGGFDGGPPPYGPPRAARPYPSGDDTTWAVMSYALTFVGGFIGPLVVYATKKEQSPFVRHHAAQALNQQLTYMIYFVVGFVAMATIAIATESPIAVLVLFVLLFGYGITELVLVLLALVHANRGEMYRLPAFTCLRMVH